MDWIEAVDLNRWANQREAQGLLPKLVRRLIRATTDDLQRADFPAGASIQAGGWDGIVESQKGNDFVPPGLSGWELGAGTGATQKANKDYEKRSQDPLGLTIAETTFVFVALRSWGKKRAWETEKRNERLWADVRAYDANDLEAWLEQAHREAVWLASRIGKLPSGVRALDEYWSTFAATTEPVLSSSLVLSGREKEVARCHDWLGAGPSILEIQGESVEEVVAFMSSVVNEMSEEKKAHWEARGLVFETADTWGSWGGRRNGQLVVLLPGDPSVASQILADGNHVLLAKTIGGKAGERTIALPRVPRSAFEDGLKEMGFKKEDARSIAIETGRSLSALRRQVSVVDSMPAWAEPARARDLLPALLAGGWDDGRDVTDRKGLADREVLAHLARIPYDELSDRLSRIAAAPDPPLRRVGTVWKLTAPTDAWLRLGRYLTEDDLQRYQEILEKVLGEDDPRLELPPENRWAAAIIGKSLKHSSWIREGLAESLALFAVFGAQAGINVRYRPADFASARVRELLRNANDTRWRSLERLLPLLAEAAPDVFFSAVGDALDENPSPLLALFVKEGPFDGGDYPNLLISLEILAWIPGYFGPLAAALGKLARLDPGGMYAYRPWNSLQQVILPWLHKSCASLDERLKAIDMLLERDPGVGWNLLFSLLPGFIFPISIQRPRWRVLIQEPRWRDWDSSFSNTLTDEECQQFVEMVGQRIIQMAEMREDRWRLVIAHIRNFPPDSRTKIRDGLRRVSKNSDSEIIKKELWEALRHLVMHHREYSEADWALSPEEIDEYEVIMQSLEPQDPLARFAWLFESAWPQLTKCKEFGSSEHWKSIVAARRDAIAKIFQHGGVAALLALARAAGRPDMVGLAAARELGNQDCEAEILRQTLGSQEDALREFAIEYVRERSFIGDSWVDKLLARTIEEHWGREAVVDLCCGLGPGGATWETVHDLGEEIETEYWRKVVVGHLEDASGTEFAIKQLLEANRIADAASLASIGMGRLISPDLVATVLMRLVLARMDTSEGRMQDVLQDVMLLFERLRNEEDFDRDSLAHLEWTYLEIFQTQGWPPATLYQILAEDPAFFANVVDWSSTAADDKNTLEPDEGLTLEQGQIQSRKANGLLRSWNVMPGLTRDRSLDGEALWTWVEEARGRCTALQQGKEGDRRIGLILSTAPGGEDGVWPAEPVRSVIERARSRDLEDGIYLGFATTRGEWRRRLGSDEARERGNRFRGYAVRTGPSWPRTSALLLSIADMYVRNAQHEDRRYELDDLRY